MARKRERFERIDVPREGPYRNLIGAVVCIVVIAAVAVIVSMTWNRANLESRMGDKGLGEAISTLSQYDAAAPGSGYVETEDELHLTLLLTADSLDAQGASLTGASILSVNSTQGTASLVSVPVDLSVTVNDEAMTLAELFSSQGYSSCVVPLGVACGVRFDDVVLATGDVLEDAAAKQVMGENRRHCVPFVVSFPDYAPLGARRLGQVALSRLPSSNRLNPVDSPTMETLRCRVKGNPWHNRK